MLFSIAKLLRIEKCFFSAFSIFLPAFHYTKDLNLSLAYSIPVFTIVASGFVINDINDLERDHVNNPERVLPRKSITIDFAIIIYFLLLISTLVIIKFFIPFRYVFVFMVYLVSITNYNYLVNSFPYFKNLYVVVVTGVHLFIIFLLVPFNMFFSGCIILNILSQELLLDLRDLKGDGNTFPKIVGNKATIQIAILLQVLQLLILTVYGRLNFIHLALIFFVTLTQVLSCIFWKKKKYKYTVYTLKAQAMMMFALIL